MVDTVDDNIMSMTKVISVGVQIAEGTITCSTHHNCFSSSADLMIYHNVFFFFFLPDTVDKILPHSSQVTSLLFSVVVKFTRCMFFRCLFLFDTFENLLSQYSQVRWSSIVPHGGSGGVGTAASVAGCPVGHGTTGSDGFFLVVGKSIPCMFLSCLFLCGTLEKLLSQYLQVRWSSILPHGGVGTVLGTKASEDCHLSLTSSL